MKNTTLDEVRQDTADQYLGALGKTAADSLQVFGVVFMFVDRDGFVRMANPDLVFVHPDALPPEQKRPYRPIRHIMTDGKPRYAVLHNGELWEVEFDEKDTT